MHSTCQSEQLQGALASRWRLQLAAVPARTSLCTSPPPHHLQPPRVSRATEFSALLSSLPVSVHVGGSGGARGTTAVTLAAPTPTGALWACLRSIHAVDLYCATAPLRPAVVTTCFYSSYPISSRVAPPVSTFLLPPLPICPLCEHLVPLH